LTSDDAPTRRGALGLAAGALAVWAFPFPAAAAGSEPFALHAVPVPLDDTDRARTRVGTLEWRGGLILGSPDRRFGGWSDLWVAPRGERFVAISDNGWTLEAALAFDGRLTGAGPARLGRLSEPDGQVVRGTDGDAEGLARLPDGGFAVSFERRHRINVYPPADPPFSKPPRALKLPAEVARAPRNGGIEALASLPDGRLLMLVEELVEEGWHVGFAGGEGQWSRVGYRCAPGFVPVGACVLPDGTSIVLERSFAFMGGFGARLARVPAGAWVADARVEGEEIARLNAPLATDNYEGIATIAQSDADILFLISDDNYSFLQRTLLVAFALPKVG
jgi:hypothetical protein